MSGIFRRVERRMVGIISAKSTRTMRILGMISAGWEVGKSSLYYLYKSPDPPYLETISK